MSAPSYDLHLVRLAEANCGGDHYAECKCHEDHEEFSEDGDDCTCDEIKRENEMDAAWDRLSDLD